MKSPGGSYVIFGIKKERGHQPEKLSEAGQGQ
jgi:hypothetical protein